MKITREDQAVAGMVYLPDPETKNEHFQRDSLVELLLPWVDGLSYGTKLDLYLEPEQAYFSV